MGVAVGASGLMWVPLAADKRPLVRWQRGEPLTLRRAARWPGMAMLARVVPEGEVVLDFDTPDQLPNVLPETATLRTRRGFHLVYRSTEAFRKAPGTVAGRSVDICPTGTLQVVWGPSREWLSLGIAELPVGLVHTSKRETKPCPYGLSGTRTFNFPPHVKHPAAYARTVIEDQIRRTWHAPEGARNSTLNKAAGMLELLAPYTTESDWRRLRRVARVAYGQYADRVDEVVAAARASINRTLSP